jgi:hypothetical protein
VKTFHPPDAVGLPDAAFTDRVAGLTPLRGGVTALDPATAVAVGQLAARTAVDGRRLVAGRTVGGSWRWIVAQAVWLDADDTEHPQHPQHVGLAVGRSIGEAVDGGLRDRLDHEIRTDDPRARRLVERVLRSRGGRPPSLGRLTHRLRAEALDVVFVDLGSPDLAGHGICRVSVQIADERNVVGRRRDAAVVG